jgi:hypothetical protein
VNPDEAISKFEMAQGSRIASAPSFSLRRADMSTPLRLEVQGCRTSVDQFLETT